MYDCYFLMYFMETNAHFILFQRQMLADFQELGRQADGSVPELKFEQLPFNHPLFIMYSSGTTGVPKCMVHSAGVCELFLENIHSI